MSPPDKRWGPGSTNGGASHVLRTTVPAGSSSNTSSSNNARSNGSIIAPPPRAQLNTSSSSSPSPEEQQQRSGQQHTPGATSGSSSINSNATNNATSTPSISPPRRSNAPSTHTIASTAAAAAGATTQQLLKEKDQEITALKRELSLMETEFTRELDKLSQNESETATFWQAKHNALNQQFLHTDAELRLLRDDVKTREADLTEELSARWRDMLQKELKERDCEIRELKGQVRGLKEWVNTSTRADGQQTLSDEVFGEGMTRLGNSLQNWVITNFRRTRLDLARAAEDETLVQELAGLVPMYEELAQTSKVHLLQSIVSRILVQMVFDAYFVGLSAEQAQQCMQVQNLMASFAGASEPINQWRSLTLTILRKEAAQKMAMQTAGTAEAVITRINRILDSITAADNSSCKGTATTTNTTEARDQALRIMVNSSIELSRQLVVQKAVFEVWMPEILPHQQVLFDHETMDDIGGEEEESLVQREICCVTFPAIIKRGDENGGQLQYRNVISKARVLCGPE